MPVRIVQSKQNARLKDLRRALAKPGRGDTLAAVEGPILISEAIRAGIHIHCVLAAQDAQPQLVSLALRSDLEVLLVPRELLDPVLTTENPQSVAALIEPPDWTWAHLFGPHQTGSPLVVVLAGIQDPGNLGTIIRSAEAFGATGIISLPGTVTAWNPKAVRASAGSLFRVPIISAGEKECLEKLREAGVNVLAATPQGDTRPANLVDLARPTALIIGNEGNGVPGDLTAKSDDRITIPCPGPVESLNAAVATSVLLYEAAQQRAISAGKSAHRGARR